MLFLEWFCYVDRFNKVVFIESVERQTYTFLFLCKNDYGRVESEDFRIARNDKDGFLIKGLGCWCRCGSYCCCCCLRRLVLLEMHSLFYPAVIFECSAVVRRRKKATNQRRKMQRKECG